jgi:hypothetical protein
MQKRLAYGIAQRIYYFKWQGMKGRNIKDSKKETAKWSIRVKETRDDTAIVGMSIDTLKEVNA